MENSNYKYLAQGAMAGAIAAAVLVIVVFATGSTFGQRCAKVYERNTKAFDQCVADLSAGKKVAP